MIHTQKWFLSKVGKRIYRDPDTYPCTDCREVVENGLIVSDEMHARYLYDIQNNYGAEGINLNYRSTK